jgi:hypothetical protein
MFIKENEGKNKWDLGVLASQLTLQERKDCILLLAFLNVCDNYDCAITQFKKVWLDIVYALPSTNADNYNSVKCSRHLALKRIKTVFKKYITATL